MIPSSSDGRAARSTALAAAGSILVAVASVHLLRTTLDRRRRSSSEGNDDATLDPMDDDPADDPARKIEDDWERSAKTSLKRSMYDNVVMLSLERAPMCTISAKKARWYVKKGLGEWTTLGEYDECYGEYDVGVRCIRFLHAENATGARFGVNMTDHLYLRSAKQNICVGCGDDRRHMRHYIVPYSYRALLPPEYKTHMSHDIVILCPDCHVRCEGETKVRMQSLEQEVRARLGDGAFDISPIVDDPERHRVRNCAIALARRGREVLPEEEAKEAERVVREYLASMCGDEERRELLLSGRTDLRKTQIQKACSVKCHVKNPAYLTPSEVVVRSLKGEGDVEEFIKGWRSHFVEVVGPRYMPNGWSVDNPVISGKEARRRGKEVVEVW